MKFNKRADIDTDSLIKIILAVIILAISITAVVLLKDKGGAILTSIKSFFQFGGL
jgi:hypothetical protein